MESYDLQFRRIDWTLRIAMFGEFFGHGIFAIQRKTNFVEMITSVLTVQQSTASTLLLAIGIVDVLVACSVLVRPIRILLLGGAVWAFATSLARPLSGDPVWDFVERWANVGVPLALLWLRGVPKSLREWFT